MKILQVNMGQQAVKFEPVAAVYERLGGRALIAKVLLEEVPATCDPLGPHNKLIVAPGLLAGANVSTTGRLSCGGKSPLTGGAEEANAGGELRAMLWVNWESKRSSSKGSPKIMSCSCSTLRGIPPS